MDHEELLKLLDLAGVEADAAPAAGLAIGGTDAGPNPSAGPTVLDLDAWGLRRGRELFESSDRLRALGLCEHAAADFLGCAFEPAPRLAGGCVDARRQAFVRELLGTPEYRALHALTALDEAAAEVAAAAFAEQFAEFRKEAAGRAAAGGAAKAGGAGEDLVALKAAGRALERASAEVAGLREAAAAFGLGPGEPGSNDPRAIAALYRRVRGDPALVRICEQAGRLRRLARSRQRQKAVHGADDLVGVAPGGEVGRLLPHELAKLAVPELEDDLLRRLAEGQALCREYRACEPAGKGPVVVCVDESGSMEGDKAHSAKALALALAWVARRQRRWCALVAYSGDSGERLLPLPPGRWDQAKLLDWLTQFLGRGSDLDVPVRELPRMYQQLGAPKGFTDVIFLTDAVCRVPAGVRDAFRAWKRASQARVTALIIDNAPGELAAVCDEAHAVHALGPAEAAVGDLLAL